MEDDGWNFSSSINIWVKPQAAWIKCKKGGDMSLVYMHISGLQVSIKIGEESAWDFLIKKRQETTKSFRNKD
jgi:hypothetical protein